MSSELFQQWSFPAGFEKALAAGADPNEPDEHGNAALPRAARTKNLTYVDLLLRAGANVDQVSQRDGGRSALAWAVENRDWRTSVALLEAGADPTLPHYGEMALEFATPLTWAFANDNKVARKIRERGEALGHSYSASEHALPWQVEKAMGKLTGGYKRSSPYLWVDKLRQLQDELLRLGGRPVSAENLGEFDCAHLLARLFAASFDPGTRLRAKPGTNAATWLEARAIETTGASPTEKALDPDRHARSLKAPITPFANVGPNIEIAVYGKNTNELVVGWDRMEPSDDITFGLGGDIKFLRELEAWSE